MINRRGVLAGAAGLVLHPFALPVSAPRAYAAEGADALVLVLSDLHSAYRQLPGALAAVDAVLSRNRGVPALAVINGDLFERSNAVALRSGGQADLAFLRALADRLPLVVNLGNHETALQDDLADVVRAFGAAGARVVTNLRDRRSGQTFAPFRLEVATGGRRFALAGIGTDDMATYRQAARASIDAPAPATFAATQLKSALAGSDLPVLLSHAGVQPDRALLPLAPDGTLVVGGHDHLRFAHREGATLYLHTGSYLTGLVAVAIFSAAGRRRFEATAIAPETAAGDRDLQALIERLSLQHLSDAERAVRAELARDLPLSAAARQLVAAMARAAGADVGLINHTTLGAGLPAGAVTAHDLAGFIRFDGTLFRAEIDAAGLEALTGAANQDGDFPFARRSGDFLYASPVPPGPGQRRTIVTNGWVKLNAGRYLGRDNLAFTELPDLKLRSVFETALKAL